MTMTMVIAKANVRMNPNWAKRRAAQFRPVNRPVKVAWIRNSDGGDDNNGEKAMMMVLMHQHLTHDKSIPTAQKQAQQLEAVMVIMIRTGPYVMQLLLKVWMGRIGIESIVAQ